MHLGCVWLLILLNLPIYLCDMKTKGPFRALISNLSECITPDRPYMKKGPIILKLLLINESNNLFLTGNFTVTRDTKNVKLRIKNSVWKDNKWIDNLFLSDLGCHGMLMYMLCSAAGINYNRKDCMYKKGYYPLKNMDINTVQHLVVTQMSYGKMLWTTELYDPWKGTYFCYDFIILTEPA